MVSEARGKPRRQVTGQTHPHAASCAVRPCVTPPPAGRTGVTGSAEIADLPVSSASAVPRAKMYPSASRDEAGTHMSLGMHFAITDDDRRQLLEMEGDD